MKVHSLKAAASTILLLVLGATYPIARADEDEGPTVVVDANATPCVTQFFAHYTTIQAAINGSGPGATILVCPGMYPEQITIPQSKTLRGVTVPNANNGAGAGAAVITVPVGGALAGNSFPWTAQVLIEATNVTLDDLTIDGTGVLPNDCTAPDIAGIVFAAGSSGTVRRAALRNQNEANGPNGSNGFCGAAIVVNQGIAGTVTIENSSVRAFGAEGITAASPIIAKHNVLEGGLSSSNLLSQGTAIVVNGASTVTSNTIGHVDFGIFYATGSGGTVSQNNISADGFGILAGADGVAISDNTITGGLQNPGLTGGNVGISVSGHSELVSRNNISGTFYGVQTVPGSSSTFSQNTINDAQVGVFGVSGNTVSGNRFLNVATLFQ